MAKLGARLAYLRRQKGLSQRELAKLLGVAQSTIAMYEGGNRTPDPEMLQRIADFFGVSLDYLMDRQESLDPPWLSKLPPEMQEFVREESKRGFPYLRLARGASLAELPPEALEAFVRAWMDAKERQRKEAREKGLPEP